MDEKIYAIPTASDTAPPGLPAMFIPTIVISSLILSTGKPICARVSRKGEY
jgi:hypothetical protein